MPVILSVRIIINNSVTLLQQVKDDKEKQKQIMVLFLNHRQSTAAVKGSCTFFGAGAEDQYGLLVCSYLLGFVTFGQRDELRPPPASGASNSRHRNECFLLPKKKKKKKDTDLDTGEETRKGKTNIPRLLSGAVAPILSAHYDSWIGLPIGSGPGS